MKEPKLQELKDKNEEDIKLIKEMQTLIQEAIDCIVMCPICHKKYIKGQSENGCPYCEIKRLVEDSENEKYENALQDTI